MATVIRSTNGPAGLARWRTWLAALLATTTVALAPDPGAVGAAQSAQATCEFALGFAALRAQIGAQTVGSCLENEHFNPANGNAEQRTTGGLLVWRKADNWTAFTDGHRTWVSGPAGLQQRPNAQRFAWEGDAGAPGTTLVGAAPTAPAGPADPNPDVHVLAADAQYVLALDTVRLRSGPGTAFPVIGGVAAGQTARTTGMSLDRQWWRVMCPDGTAGTCWISADPQLTQPVALYDQGTPWRSHESVRYGFRIELPAWGSRLGADGRLEKGPCGQAIREDGLSGMEGVVLDNMAFVQVVEWHGSIREYLARTEPNAAQIDRLYTLQPVVSNADEAVVVERRPGVESAAFPVPLGNTLALHKKGSRLLVVRPLQNPAGPNGCLADPAPQLQRIAASVLFT